MPLKGSGPADVEVVDRFDRGVGWLAFPDEAMQRASHALVGDDGRVWVVEPVDVEGVDDLLAEYGEVAGTVVLMDRHERDAGPIARRHDVPVYVPAWMGGVADSIGTRVERFDGTLGGFSVERVIDNPLWQEATLFDGETLVVPEALGTVPYFRAAGERLGVHPLLRPLPPRSLRAYDPDRLLVGHGAGLTTDVGAGIREAIDGSRGRMLSLYASNLRALAGLQ